MIGMHISLQWRHDGLDGVANRQPHHCLLSRLFGRRSKKTPNLHVTGLCAGNSPGTGEFLAQMASNAESVSIWWRHHVYKTNWVYPDICQCHNNLAPSIQNNLTCTTDVWCDLSAIQTFFNRRRIIKSHTHIDIHEHCEKTASACAVTH